MGVRGGRRGSQPGAIRHHRTAQAVLYVGFSWLLLIAPPPALRVLTAPEIVCLFAGGLLYTLGALGFSLERADPRPRVFGYHEVWHATTLAATGFHFALVLQLVRT